MNLKYLVLLNCFQRNHALQAVNVSIIINDVIKDLTSLSSRHPQNNILFLWNPEHVSFWAQCRRKRNTQISNVCIHLCCSENTAWIGVIITLMKYQGEFCSGSRFGSLKYLWVCASCFKIFQHTFYFDILNFIDFLRLLDWLEKMAVPIELSLWL